jgi:hypothetical protein
VKYLISAVALLMVSCQEVPDNSFDRIPYSDSDLKKIKQAYVALVELDSALNQQNNFGSGSGGLKPV